jgi:hypothetical protein
MAHEEILTIDSTNVIELTGLRSRVSGEYLTLSTVDADLFAADGTTPITGAQNLTLSLVATSVVGGQASSRTMYRGRIPAAVVLTNGTSYILKVTAIESGVQRVFRITCKAKWG